VIIKNSSTNGIFVFLLSILLITEGLLFILSVYKTGLIFGISLILMGLILIKFYYSKTTSSANFESLKEILEPIRISPEILGTVLVFSVILYEYFYSTNTTGNYSILVIVLGLYIVLFDRISKDYSYEKYFILYFFIIYSVLIVLPILLFMVTNEVLDNTGELNTTLVNLLLVRPLNFLLIVSGLETFISSETISYRDINNVINRIHIARECTGIDSVIIFISAFTAYLINDFFKSKTLFFSYLTIGIIVSYFANLLRMYLIIIVGYFYGPEMLYWVHTNVGWLIFILWMSIFWYFLPNPTLSNKL